MTELCCKGFLGKNNEFYKSLTVAMLRLFYYSLKAIHVMYIYDFSINIKVLFIANAKEITSKL